MCYVLYIFGVGKPSQKIYCQQLYLLNKQRSFLLSLDDGVGCSIHILNITSCYNAYVAIPHILIFFSLVQKLDDGSAATIRRRHVISYIKITLEIRHHVHTLSTNSQTETLIGKHPKSHYMGIQTHQPLAIRLHNTHVHVQVYVSTDLLLWTSFSSNSHSKSRIIRKNILP